MNKFQDLKLFSDLNLISQKYSNIKANIDADELITNSNLKNSLETHSSNLDELRSKVNFVYSETISQISSLDNSKLEPVLNSVNKFSQDKLNLVRIYAKTLTSPSVRSILDATLDELVLINSSISNRDFRTDKSAHLFIYTETVVSAFATFLSLKEFMDDQDAINCLSQAIFNQMKSISLASKLN